MRTTVLFTEEMMRKAIAEAVERTHGVHGKQFKPEGVRLQYSERMSERPGEPLFSAAVTSEEFSTWCFADIVSTPPEEQR